MSKAWDVLVALHLEALAGDGRDSGLREVVLWRVCFVDVAHGTALGDAAGGVVTPQWGPAPSLALREGELRAGSLRDALDQLDAVLVSRVLQHKKSFVVLTDGPSPLRAVLALEAARKGIPLRPYLRTFFDLRVEFRKAYPSAPPTAAADSHAMAEFLGIPGDGDAADLVEQITQRLIRDGHAFVAPETMPELDPTAPTISPRVPIMAPLVAPAVPVGGVLRLRGLPWTSNEDDIKTFFAGLTIAPGGIHLVFDPRGKVTGEAFMQVTTPDAVNQALKKHRQTMGKRYVEVFKSSPQEMVAMTKSTLETPRRMHHPPQPPVPTHMPVPPPVMLHPPPAAPHQPQPGGTLPMTMALHDPLAVRVRGLPFNVTFDDISAFFAGLDVNPLRVQVLGTPDGRPVGEAYIRFDSEASVEMALAHNGKAMGSRYIEVLRATQLDAAPNPTVILDSAAHVAPGVPTPLPIPSMVGSYPPHHRPQHISVAANPVGPLAPPSLAEEPAVHPARPTHPTSVVRMRGLPYTCSKSDIFEFFDGFEIIDNGVLFGSDRVGRASGEAWVTFSSPEQAERAVATLNKRHIGNRYIDLLLAPR